MTIWEDKETGEIHWHMSEYQDLLKKITDLESKVAKIEQAIFQMKKMMSQ